MPISSILLATNCGILASVMMMSTSSSPLIFAKPRRPNLLESAKTMVFYAAFIILLFSSASRMSVVEIPKSRSIPSTPKKSFVNEQPRSISMLYCPTTDTLLWRTIPTKLDNINVIVGSQGHCGLQAC